MLRFRQLIRVVLLGLVIGLPVTARAEIIYESNADSSASDSSASDSSSGDSSVDTTSSDSASSDSSSSDSSSDSPSDSSTSDDPSSGVIDLLADPSQADSLLNDSSGSDSGSSLGTMDSGDLDPSSGDTSFTLTDSTQTDTLDCVAVPTPEPGSLLLWTIAIAGVIGLRWRRRQQPSVA